MLPRWTLLAIAALANAAVLPAVGAAEPKVSTALVTQLKAAQEALGKGQYNEALADIQRALASPTDKNAYDTYVIDVMLVRVYQGTGDPAALARSLHQIAASPYAQPDSKKDWYRYIAQYEYGQKNYQGAIDAAQSAIGYGADDEDTAMLVAKAMYLQGKYSDADRQVMGIVSKEPRPSKDALTLARQFCLQANDTVGADKALEKYVALYSHNVPTDFERQRLGDLHIEETRPQRRDGPLRELNVSDDEVRQIQSAVASVLPQKFVTIGGVVTGCPTEEGLTCTDQVWVDVRAPNRTVGLLLSKVDDQWIIGKVQRWWLCDADLEAHRRNFTSYDAYLSAKRTLASHFPQCAVTTDVGAHP